MLPTEYPLVAYLVAFHGDLVVLQKAMDGTFVLPQLDIDKKDEARFSAQRLTACLEAYGTCTPPVFVHRFWTSEEKRADVFVCNFTGELSGEFYAKNPSDLRGLYPLHASFVTCAVHRRIAK